MTAQEPLQKSDFGAIYDLPDPRAYFLTLGPLDYTIPQTGAEMFARLLTFREAQNASPARILDVCCSYGVVGQLLKTGLTMADLNAHYGQADLAGLTRDELILADRVLLASHEGPVPVEVVGLDVASNAVDYARASGALNAGFAENLEIDEPSAALRDAAADIDMITITGGIGYVTETTFTQLVEAAPPNVWIAAFCLRTYDYSEIERSLAGRDMTTERLPMTFPQRRFTDVEEQHWAINMVRERGLDPTGKEADGSYHADFYLSRPSADAEALPLSDLAQAAGLQF